MFHGSELLDSIISAGSDPGSDLVFCAISECATPGGIKVRPHKNKI
jgi:hypothetical protein